jgi:hypothetical protein
VLLKEVLRRISGEISVNENRRKRYNNIMQLFLYLDIISLVELSRWQWIGRIIRMDSESESIQIFNNNPQGSPLRG